MLTVEELEAIKDVVIDYAGCTPEYSVPMWESILVKLEDLIWSEKHAQ